jgi:septal ring factor EnvC (AmiA/AmiB activator)
VSSEKREARGEKRIHGAAMRGVLFTSCFLLLASRLPAQANPELERSRQRLEQIRRERDQLQQQQQRLQGQVTDVNAQLRNLERQRETTSSLVQEIERQIGGLGSELERSAAEVTLAEDNMVERKAVLQRRLADIYKRGSLYTFQVLLAAESFGDLVTRYKYLHLTSRQDRSLVAEVERLAARVRSRRNELLGIQTELDRRRQEREAELERYGDLMTERQSTLRTLQRNTTQTRERLTALERDEARLNDLLANLERARRNAGGTPTPAGTGLTTSSLGRLDWPVEGEILYQFGREQLPNGGVILRNGIGISSAVGTTVKAVAAGTVALRQRLGTYGLTLIVEHGNGYYAVYAQLASASVAQGDRISAGQIIGTVGGEGSDRGPHLYFEIRGENQIALDPLTWLRRK